MAQKLRWSPYGIDRRIVGLGSPDTCRDAENFLFEDGRAFQRNGLLSFNVTGLAVGHQIAAGANLTVDLSPKVFVVTNGNKLYRTNGTTFTEITPATANIIGNIRYSGFAGFLGALYVSDYTNGVFNANLTANTYTRVSATGYQYLTSHLSRLIGAVTIGSASSLRRIGWTVSGNGDDWAGAGSGSNDLADVEDFAIEGLYNINNQIVILHTSGVHMAYPTGISSPAYRFEEVLSDMDPVMGGQCAYGDGMFYVGKANVYRFDGSQMSPIGDKVIPEIMYHTRRTNCAWRGFVSDGAGEVSTGNRRPSRLRYHLVPIRVGSTTATVPHYCLDINEQVWSKHTYSSLDFLEAFDFHVGSAVNTAGPGMWDYTTAGRIHHWSDTVTCEKDAFVESPVLLVGEDDLDYVCDRMLLMHRDVGAAALVVNLITQQSDGAEMTYTKTVNVGAVGATERMLRAWVDERLTGNGFKIKVTCPASSKCDLTFVTAMFGEGGVFRG